jgi:hypothetical protein
MQNARNQRQIRNVLHYCCFHADPVAYSAPRNSSQNNIAATNGKELAFLENKEWTDVRKEALVTHLQHRQQWKCCSNYS